MKQEGQECFLRKCVDKALMTVCLFWAVMMM